MRLAAGILATTILLAAAAASGCGASDAVGRATHHSAQRAKPALRVKGRHLVNRRGGTVRLLGVNRSGTEYACAQGWGTFDGPSSLASVRAIRRWHANAVAIPLNEACWLGINGVDPAHGGKRYRAAIATYVTRIEKAHMHPILRLSTAAPGGGLNGGDTDPAGDSAELPMADADHSPAFWRAVAKRFRRDRKLLFDIYDEPRSISWKCLRDGCQTSDDRFGDYRAAGTQKLVNAIRRTGARQPIIVPGLGYSGDLRRWLKFRPHDRRHALVADFHTFADPSAGWIDCDSGCRKVVVRVARNVPVVSTIGEYDCAHSYIDDFMRFADRHGISYLGWTWDAVAPGGWSCSNALISDYDGTPTNFGIGLRDHLRALARRR